MKLKEYIKVLTEIEKTHPDAKLVYSCDEEGNNFSEVFYEPAVGEFDGTGWRTAGECDADGGEVNAVCVN